MNPKIGIIGRGFVGNAVLESFSENFNVNIEVRVFDKDPSKSIHSLDETVNKSQFIFISVPTPANFDGSINIDTLESLLNDINEVYNSSKGNIFLIRSTIVPGTTRKLQRKFKNLKLVFNPEFLRERHALSDFNNQTKCIIGGLKKNTNKVAQLMRWKFGENIGILETNFETAEIVKYMINTFLATKVSFLNDMKLLNDEIGSNWKEAIQGFSMDKRVGGSHLDVPGHDGYLGFGGSCFPKDIQAIIFQADKLGIDLAVLKGAWKTNLKVRKNKDWEELEGRAIIKNKEENEK